MLSSLTWRLRKAERDLSEIYDAADRLVDMGVVLRVVVADPAGKEYLRGKPRLRILREHRRGGVVDTAIAPRRFVGPSQDPVVWYCSPVAEPLILHGEDIPSRMLVYGAMGAGKTTTLAQWLAFRALEFTGLGGELGATAPTMDRSTLIARAVRDLWPEAWWTWRERDHTFAVANGLTIRIVSTHKRSEASGSSVQGWDWLAHAGDEVQDQLAVDSDIEARGRDAPGARYRRFCTATAKDSPDWRTWRDFALSSKLDGKPLWGQVHMVGPDSPFIEPQWWDQLRETMSEREYARKVLAVDVGPEEMVYTSWDRRANLLPVPQIGAEDVTRRVLAPYGPMFGALVGHDPGAICDVSLILKAYQSRGDRAHSWFVVDELTTERTTAEEHSAALMARLRDRHGLHRLDLHNRPEDGSMIALVRADPYSNSGNDDRRPDRSVFVTMANAGLHVRPAVYGKPHTGSTVGSNLPGVVPKAAGIDMINQLLRSASGVRRLFVACDDRGTPLAPRLVAALERSERDASGRAETQAKRAGDLSHWPAALRYALWELERPRFAA